MNDRYAPEIVEIRRQAAPLRQQVLDGLRRAIVSGRLAAGERITERSLIERFGVSRTVIREALRQIEAEGLIEIIPHRGPVVRKLKPAEAEDLYRIRAVLEGLAARLFAENAAESVVDELAAALDEVTAASGGKDGEQAVEAKNRFYDLLYTGGNSETLGAMLEAVRARVWQWRTVGLTHPRRAEQRQSDSIENLRRMVSAIRLRDGAQAEAIAREEVGKAAEEVMRLIAAGQPAD